MITGINNAFLYAVSKIEVVFSDGKQSLKSQGTGFYVQSEKDLYLVTNRHVIDLEYKDDKYKGYTLSSISMDARSYNKKTGSVEIKNLPLSKSDITYPECEDDDIAVLSSIHTSATDGSIKTSFDISLFADTDDFKLNLNAGDYIGMIGFPIVYDYKNVMPILRSGVISSDPRLNYPLNEKPNAHILAYECFSTPGASGSPVFAYQKGFKVGDGLDAPEDFYRRMMLIGINAGGFSDLSGTHQQMSYLFKSDEILKIIKGIEN